MQGFVEPLTLPSTYRFSLNQIESLRYKISRREAKLGVAIPITDRSEEVIFGQIFVPGGVLPAGCILEVTQSKEKRPSSESPLCEDPAPQSGMNNNTHIALC